MTFSLWDQAQGKRPWNNGNWPGRCQWCGRRLEFGDYASIYVGESYTAVVVHEICSQHGGKHMDCLKGIEVDFGDGKSWPVIWASNLLNELSFWLKSIMRFIWLVLTHLLFIVVHPLRYRRHRQKMRE